METLLNINEYISYLDFISSLKSMSAMNYIFKKMKHSNIIIFVKKTDVFFGPLKSLMNFSLHFF